ncbi:MAG TPA: hypothetical protein VJ249_03055 [Candidatus Bathyarchaeia archaeon]|nr:hypothetical protein [Candidatus Bathyarchaeia archaeon]
MVKTKRSRKPATKAHIQKLAREDLSANQIIRVLKAEHRGIRRTTALAMIREERGPKRIAVYSKHRGISKRYELFGTGKQLSSIMIDTVKHPPRKRITRVSAEKLKSFSQRSKYIDYKEEWDRRPTIKS